MAARRPLLSLSPPPRLFRTGGLSQPTVSMNTLVVLPRAMLGLHMLTEGPLGPSILFGLAILHTDALPPLYADVPDVNVILCLHA